MEKLFIRNETESDYEVVEDITRNAFWNVYVPGCYEHYLVHVMRKHEDFIPMLDFVAELDGQIIGNIMYTKSAIRDEAGHLKPVLTFGPISILPEYQRRGYGKALMEYSFQKAAEMGHDLIVIFGNPGNYVGSGFKSCKKYNICAEDGSFPSAMLVKELKQKVLDGRKWYYHESPVYNIDIDEAEKFDRKFKEKEKEYKKSQEEFYIYSRSVILGE